MHLDYTPEQQALRADIRAQLATVMTPERAAAVSRRAEGGPAVKECVRALAAANLLGVGWPEQYGGRGFSAIEQHIFFEEAKRVGAPIPLVTLNTVDGGLPLFAFPPGTGDALGYAELAGHLKFVAFHAFNVS